MKRAYALAALDQLDGAVGKVLHRKNRERNKSNLASEEPKAKLPLVEAKQGRVKKNEEDIMKFSSSLWAPKTDKIIPLVKGLTKSGWAGINAATLEIDEELTGRKQEVVMKEEEELAIIAVQAQRAIK